MKLCKLLQWISLVTLLTVGVGQGMATEIKPQALQPAVISDLTPGRELSDNKVLKPGL